MKYTVSEYKCKNGSKGLIVNTPESDVVYLRVGFRGGSRQVHEYKSKEQTAHLLEHMSFNVCGFTSQGEFDRIFSMNGGNSNALRNLMT